MGTKSWDTIDLGGLSMEVESEDDDQEKLTERSERLTSVELHKLLVDQDQEVAIEIDNMHTSQKYHGKVLDASKSGIKIETEGECSARDTLRVSFSLGKRKISCKAAVRWLKNDTGVRIVGMEYLNLNEKDVDFLESLVSAKHINKVLR